MLIQVYTKYLKKEKVKSDVSAENFIRFFLR